jgi:hypothetical protein
LVQSGLVGLRYDVRAHGILHCTGRQEFDGAEAPAAQMRVLGGERRVIRHRCRRRPTRRRRWLRSRFMSAGAAARLRLAS